MIKLHLREMMAQRDWNQKELSTRTGIRPNLVMELYHGLWKSIKPETLDKLCSTFECQPGDLLTYEEESPDQRHGKSKKTRE